MIEGVALAPANGGGPDWEAVAGRLAARLRGRDQTCFFDAGRERLRALVLIPDAAAAERVAEICDAVGAAERVALGLSGACRGVADCRRALDEAARAAGIARILRPGGGAMAYEQLGVYKYLAALDPDKTPRDRHRIAVEALADHDRRRRTALLDTLEEYLARRRSIAETARVLFIHPNTLRQRLDRIERVSGLELAREDLLALELAVKLVRLDAARRRPLNA